MKQASLRMYEIIVFHSFSLIFQPSYFYYEEHFIMILVFLIMMLDI